MRHSTLTVAGSLAAAVFLGSPLSAEESGMLYKGHLIANTPGCGFNGNEVEVQINAKEVKGNYKTRTGTASFSGAMSGMSFRINSEGRSGTTTVSGTVADEKLELTIHPNLQVHGHHRAVRLLRHGTKAEGMTSVSTRITHP